MNNSSITQSCTTLLAHEDFSWIRVMQQQLPHAQIYLVGGIVRDILIGRSSCDTDFVVCNVDAETLKEFLTTQGIVNLVGKHFGVFKFTPHLSSGIYPAFDIALPRTDHALKTGGYRDVDVQSDPSLAIEDDLARRDFTINALAWNINSEKLIDEWNGLRDIENKCITTVGNPHERFQEDYSRMLRALRFSCQLDFTIEPETFQSIQTLIPHLNDIDTKNERIVPYESIAKELIKSLVAHPVRTLDLWDSANAWSFVMPELLLMKGCPQHHEFHAEGDVFIHTRLALLKLTSPDCLTFINTHFPEYCKRLANPYSPENIIAVLLHDIAKPETLETPETHGVDRIRTHEHDSIGAIKAREICERLKLSSPQHIGVDVDMVEWLIKYHLIAGHGNIPNMKATTIEKYFFKDPLKGCNLLMMLYADGSATINPLGIPATDVLFTMIEKINSLLAIFKKKAAVLKLPKPLLDGNEIMELLDLKPSKQIGELLHSAREAQLQGIITTKEDARDYLQKHI